MKKIFCYSLVFISTILCSEAFCQSLPKTSWGTETMVDTYKIGIGDKLEITTWKEPDFTRDNVLVRTDGKISFPLLNDIPAAGLSPMELKHNLETGLKSFVENPVITVHINDAVSQKFYVLGEGQLKPIDSIIFYNSRIIQKVSFGWSVF